MCSQEGSQHRGDTALHCDLMFRREWSPFLLVILGAAGIGQALFVVAAWKGAGYVDWHSFWSAGHGCVTGQWSLYDVETRRTSEQFVYTNLTLPHGHLLFLPLAALPIDLAAAIWLVANIGAVAISVQIVARERGKNLTLGELVWLLASAPLLSQLMTGQVAGLLCLPAVLSWRAVRRGRWSNAGVHIGMLTALKPFLAPLCLWLIAKREWKAACIAVTTALVLLGTGVVIFGTDSYRDWIVTVQGVSWVPAPMNASWWGVASRLTLNVTPRAVEPGGGYLAVGLLGVSFIALATLQALRRLSDCGQWLLILASSLLCAPLGWTYYALWLLPGWMLYGIPRFSAVLWVLPLWFVINPLEPGWRPASINSLYGYALLACWWSFRRHNESLSVERPGPSTTWARDITA